MKKENPAAVVFRRLLLSWLMAATLEYALLPTPLRNLDTLSGLGEMSMPRLLLIAVSLFCVLSILSALFSTTQWERLGLWGMTVALIGLSLWASFTWPFFGVGILLVLLVLCYARLGWNGQPIRAVSKQNGSPWAKRITVILCLLFFGLVSAWTVGRYLTFSSPTYDFGIFSQMFHHMRMTGLPNTTLERDGLLSHFAVHVSPVYYLMLPFYCLFPSPVTLQVLQAAVLASAVIPLWLLARQQGLSFWSCAAVCALLLLYPAYSGGTGYDLHENAFLTPLLLWLFWSMQQKSTGFTVFFAFLTLSVKEDAAVYVAVAGLYFFIYALLHRHEKRTLYMGSVLLITAIVWFLAVTHYLSTFGDGVMTYRYDNFMYDGGSSLLTVIKAVILCPMKAVYECVDPEKLPFLAMTMLPLWGLPLLTRRYERFILLIPYLLINLMSDYRYQHDIFYQYTFGSTAFLLYLTLCNLSDLMDRIRQPAYKVLLLIIPLAASLLCFCTGVLPTAIRYPSQYIAYHGYYTAVEDTLSKLPEKASVTATTFYTAHLSQREVLYDVRYSSKEHMLSTDYIVLSVREESSYTAYGGFDGLTALLEENGYQVFTELEDVLVIYQKN